MNRRRAGSRARSLAAVGAVALCAAACAQQPPQTSTTEPPAATTPPSSSAEAAPASEPAGPLAALAWLPGCWQGNVNQRDFREQWLPLRGDLLVGAGQSVLRGKVQDYQYMRIEPKADGIYFSQFSGDRKETSFRLVAARTEDKDTIFTFANTVAAFPERLIYRRGAEGWLYETIEGTLNGSERKVIYPLRRVDCETGELVHR